MRLIAAGFPVVGRERLRVEDLGWDGPLRTVVAYDDNTQTFWVYDSYLASARGYGGLQL